MNGSLLGKKKKKKKKVKKKKSTNEYDNMAEGDLVENQKVLEN